MRAHLRKHTPTAARWIGQAFLRPDDAVIDIGAHHGVFAELWAEMVPRGTVLAVEPHPTGTQCHTGARWRQMAVGATVGESTFYRSHEPSHSSLYAANVGPDVPPCMVPMTTVDALVASLPQAPRLIKVDAQGAEAAILRGATQTLRLPVVWIVELWCEGLARAGATLLEVLQPFHWYRYQPLTVYGRSLRWREVVADAEARGSGSADVLLVPAGLS